MPESPPPPRDPFLQARYDQLWIGSLPRIHSGAIEIDPVLAANQPDLRRGLTLLFRPPPGVQNRIIAALDELHAIEPDQHYYHPAELHNTFLSLFTATENNAPPFARTEEFADAVAAALHGIAPFPMTFAGLTASPAAILVQGFTDSALLNAARDRLRDELHVRGLTRDLSERYRLESAHLTVLRFQKPLRNPATFAHALERLRPRDFGHADLTSLELAQNDWYMSRATTQTLRTFSLPS